MKNTVLIFFILGVIGINLLSAQTESPYYKFGNMEGSIESSVSKVKDALNKNDFKVIGEYKVGNQENLYVVCYTHPDLEKIALSYADRGSLAATLKVGFKKEADGVTLSIINPMYLFYAYFNTEIDSNESELSIISEKAINTLSLIGNKAEPFGGSLKKEKLQKYHYKVMMPYFKDAEKLRIFDSFEEGLETINSNLNAGKSQTKKVYELIYNEKNVALFGVALLNPDDGESKFLPIIGDDHLAAMPYEIILQNKIATILPGRYRIALHWPELTMGTFMKIMSTPGDIKNTLEELTK